MKSSKQYYLSDIPAWLVEARRKRTIKEKFFNFIAKIYVFIWWERQSRKHKSPYQFDKVKKRND